MLSNMKHFLWNICSLYILKLCMYSVECAPCSSSGNGLELIILHNNDMHGRFKQTDVNANGCLPEDATADKCYGGFARIASIVQKYRNDYVQGGLPVLFLNAGDTYRGTELFEQYTDKITVEFMNLLRPDAMALGNHEFDLNINGLIPFIENVNFPVLAANINTTNTPNLEKIKNLTKSIILNVANFKIGVIGYITPDTKFLATPNALEFTDEVKSISEESKNLKSNGVQIIIALGHSGYDIDKAIASNCPDVDVVVGGHSHTFLYSGPQPDVEEPEGEYPTVVTNAVNGKIIPVVQAFAYTKYLGYLKLHFDPNGRLIKFNGKPILLNKDVAQNATFLDLLNKYPLKNLASQNEVIVHSKVYLSGTCRFSECNMGNLLTDALVDAYVQQYNGEYWTDTSIAIMTGGGIRTSANPGNITLEKLHSIVAYPSSVDCITLTGKEIKAALEHSVERYDPDNGRGEFIQMSGMHVVYDLSKLSGSRVHKVRVLCTNCITPHYENLVEDKNYNIITTSFINTGGDGYYMFKKPAFKHFNVTHDTMTEIYMRKLKVIYPKVEDRIVFE